MIKKIAITSSAIFSVFFTPIIGAVDTQIDTKKTTEIMQNVTAQEVLNETIEKTGVYTQNTVVMKVDSSVAYVNNSRATLTSRNRAIIRNDGKAVIPIRFLAEALDAKIEYYYEKNKIVVKDDGTILTIYIDTHMVLKNGVLVSSDFELQIIDEMVYVPVREIGDILGITIDYQKKDDGDYIVAIKSIDGFSNDVNIPTKISTVEISRTYNGFIKPVSGTEYGYYGDSGLDIWCPMGTPVYAIADCYINFSEYGHTPWQGANDTAYSIMITFDKPVTVNGATLKRAFYTHLSALVYNGNPGRMIHQGELIGYSGTANGTPHLHFEFLEMDTMSFARSVYSSYIGDVWTAGN